MTGPRLRPLAETARALRGRTVEAPRTGASDDANMLVFRHQQRESAS